MEIMMAMSYEVMVVRGTGDEDFNWRVAVLDPSLRHNNYGRIYRHALNEDGSIKKFATEGQAWECAAALSRGMPPNVELSGSTH